jgi:hypothetical protein
MMYGVGGILIVAAFLLVAVLILVLPLRLAAQAMGAKHSGVGACLLALIAAAFMQVLGLSVPVYGSIVAFLLSSATFAAILGTDFLRGIGISILHVVFSVMLLFIAALVMCVGLSALMCV